MGIHDEFLKNLPLSAVMKIENNPFYTLSLMKELFTAIRTIV